MYSHHRIPRSAQTRRHVSPTSAQTRNARAGSASFPLGSIRPTVLLLAKALLVPLASAAPLSIFRRDVSTFEEDAPKSADDPNLWVYLGVAIALVLLGGAFAGLTIALMGQDETYLQVLAASGEGSEKKNAEKVLALLKKGKHWVLVTLLLSNVITNETLPIVLDRSLGGGWPAVLSSTVLIVIFGEIVPQSICVRYGLGIGAFMAPLVLSLMWIMCPVAWPTAKLLDYLLGKDHGTMYKKAGLKTLVTLHKALGPATGERLMEDEVTIINSVLDLKDKPVGDIMTPMEDVFTMSADTILDERMMDTILSQGYSRIPIYAPDNNRNFIGMLLVKILITYDPEDGRRVRDFSLATLPETAPYTSCLDIINFFQEGKSHMVLVSEFPGYAKGALGVVTLEDVIEELIGEEIIDESDVFVDVHKAIRRLTPAPKKHFKRDAGGLEPSFTHDSYMDANENEPLLNKDGTPSRKQSLTKVGAPATFLMRRKSSSASEPANGPPTTVPVRSNTAEMREHLKHLGPSNAASKPRATKFSSVKIKPGVGTIPENQTTTKGTDIPSETPSSRSKSADAVPDAHIPAKSPDLNGEAERLLRSAGKDASGGAAALRATAGYGTLTGSPESGSRPAGMPRGMSASEASRVAEENAQTEAESLTFSSSALPPPGIDGDRSRDTLKPPEKLVVGSAGEDGDTLGDLTPSRQRSQSRRQARSGSITETEVEVGGLTKVVLEMTSSSEDEEVADDGKSGKNGLGKKGSGSS